jgi:hypothetical protein
MELKIKRYFSVMLDVYTATFKAPIPQSVSKFTFDIDEK